VVAAATFVAGSLEAVNVRNQYPGQQLLAVAMRVGAADVVAANRINPAFAELAERAGVYPFTDDFELGCGVRLGQRISRAAQLPAGSGHVDTGPVSGGAEVRGWAMVEGRRIDCVFVVDGSDTVVGGGYTGIARPDIPGVTGVPELRSGWVAVAAPSTVGGEIIVSSGGAFYRIQ
jgi:hypothetical protein